MECPKKCGGELKIFEMNGVKYAQCNNCGQVFSADSLRAQIAASSQTATPSAPKEKKKGSCLKIILILLCALLVFLIIICIFTDHKEETTPPEDTTGEDKPLNDYVDDVMPMETLLFQVEADVSTRYDGYTLDHDEDSITINAWRESTTNAVNILQNNSGNVDDDNWIWLRNYTGNAPDCICDCIRSSGRDMTLYFNVLDDQDHNRILFKFVDTDIVYDILAEQE